MQEVSEDNRENFSSDTSNQANLSKPPIPGKPTKYTVEEKPKELGASNDEIGIQENDDDDEENVSYHSDSDSTVMMSGNSPFVSKAARYNFLSRSSEYQNITYFFISMNSCLGKKSLLNKP